MYLCHSEILMPKDTESLGNNKAPACESRGFVRKIMKVCFLTHLLAADCNNLPFKRPWSAIGNGLFFPLFVI